MKWMVALLGTFCCCISCCYCCCYNCYCFQHPHMSMVVKCLSLRMFDTRSTDKTVIINCMTRRNRLASTTLARSFRCWSLPVFSAVMCSGTNIALTPQRLDWLGLNRRWNENKLILGWEGVVFVSLYKGFSRMNAGKYLEWPFFSVKINGFCYGERQCYISDEVSL